MAEVTVRLRYARVAPRKARAVVDLVRGKPADWAEAQLAVLTKRAAKPVLKLLKAGRAAAKDKKMDTSRLFIKHVVVNEGPRLKRARAHFRGVVRPIDKQLSHLTLVLTDEEVSVRPPKMSAAKGAGHGS